jgi:hypothetical protein
MPSESEPNRNLSPPMSETETTGAKGGFKALSLPPLARRSSSIGGSVLGTASKTKESDHQFLASLHHASSVPDSVTSSDDEGTSRSALRRAIVEYRRCLTLSELSFLKEVVSLGSDTHIERALHKLKDETIFSPPSPESKHKHDVDGERRVETTSIHVSPSQLKEKQIKSQTAQTNTLLISGSGEDSLVFLERLKKSIQEKDPHSNQNVLHAHEAFDLHKPIDIMDRTTSFGSEARGAHIEKRMASTVHGNMWKAHESGISLSAKPRSRLPPIVGVMERPDPIQRSTSVMSSSTMDLVENGGPVACDMLDPIFRSYSPPRHLFLDRKAIADLNESSVGQGHERSRCHSRSDSIASVSSIGSSHFDWPPSNFDTVFRSRIHALQQRTRSPSLGKKIHSMDLDDHNFSTAKDTPSRLKHLPPINQMRRNSSARSISSIPSLHRASLLRSFSTACTFFVYLSLFFTSILRVETKWPSFILLL